MQNDQFWNNVMQLWKAPIQDLWPKEWLGIDWQWGIQSRWVSHTVSCVENKLLVSCLESFLSLPVPLQHTCASQHLCMLHAAPFSQGQETSACENIIAVVWVKTLLSLTWFGKCTVFNVLNNFYCMYCYYNWLQYVLTGTINFALLLTLWCILLFFVGWRVIERNVHYLKGVDLQLNCVMKTACEG